MAKIDLSLRSGLSLSGLPRDTHNEHDEVRTSTVPSTAPAIGDPAIVDVREITSPLASGVAPETSINPVQLWPTPCPMFTYLAGAAGSGKTFATKDWAAKERGLLLCATTGIAAINLGGTTINAQLGYFDTKSLMESYTNGFLTARLGKLWKAGVRRLVLDEVSMLDGDQLTYLVKAIEEVNGRGYILKSQEGEEDSEASLGLTLVGDFAQLPPVKAPFAFESSEWSRFAEPGGTITLTEIRRQADPAFIEALRAARAGDGRGALAFFGPMLQQETDDHFAGPTLLAKNDSVDRYNWLRLNKLAGADCYFESRREGKQRSEWGNPDKPPATWGIPLRLHLKIGALVMVLANKRNYPMPGFAYVNGDLGELVDADETNKLAHVKLQRTGQVVLVDYVRREVLLPMDSARRKELVALGQQDKIAEGGKWEIAGWISYLPLRVAYASTVHKCVSAGTRIPVHRRGYIPIEQVAIGDITPYGEIKGIAKSDQPAWRVTTRRGYTVTCSAEHRWVTRNGFRSAEQFVDGEGIALQHGVPFGGQDTLTPSETWLLGLLVGDGCYTDREEGQVHLACTNAVLGDKFRETATNLYKIPVAWRKDERGLYWTSQATRRYLLSLGLEYVKAPLKRIPHAIWECGPRERGWFLRGLFDADGHIGRNRIILTTASEFLGIDVQEMLLTLGVVSSRTRYAGNYKGQRRPYWQVYVAAECYDRFREAVNFFHPDKQKKLAASRPNRALNPALGFDTVASVEPLGVTTAMYDIEVPNPHVVAFGPFLGHNSQGLSLDHVQVNIRDAFFKSSGMLYVALSRARSAAGLRLVGSAAAFVERCTYDPRLKQWL